MAAGYVLIRPVAAPPPVSASAVTFALVSAFLVATYPALAIWVPTRAHIVRAAVFAGLGAPSSRSGGSGPARRTKANPAIELPIALSPLALAATYLCSARRRSCPGRRASRGRS